MLELSLCAEYSPMPSPQCQQKLHSVRSFRNYGTPKHHTVYSLNLCGSQIDGVSQKQPENDT